VTIETPGPALLRPAQAAVLIGCSRTRIYDLVAEQRIPSSRVLGSLRIPRDALLAWIEANIQPALGD